MKHDVVSWWPAIIAWIWLSFVIAVAGYPAAFFSGLTGIAVALLGLYEAGAKKARQPADIPPNPTQDKGA